MSVTKAPLTIYIVDLRFPSNWKCVYFFSDPHVEILWLKSFVGFVFEKCLKKSTPSLKRNLANMT